MTALRRFAPPLLALACLCAGVLPAAAQTRDTTAQKPPATQVPESQLPPARPPPQEKPPADTPAARPTVRIPSVQLPDVRLPPIRSRTVTVPSLAGRTPAEARQALVSAGLVMGQVTELPVDRPAGTVFMQSPAAGTQARRGSPVSVTVAQAPVRTAVMPDVVGQSLVVAVRRIEAAGLRVGSVEGASGATARVSGQSYAAGQRVRPGTAVGLSMTAPPAPVVATRPATPAQRPPVQQPATPPVAQNPPAQQPASPPTRVDSVAVPDVATLALADARAALQGAGLAAAVDAGLADSASWTVAAQFPAAGARVPLGGDVELSLEPPPAPIAVAEPPVVQPPVAGTAEPARPAETAPAAQPAEAPVRRLPWLWIVLAILLIAAASFATRRLRARSPAAVAPVGVSARVRTEAGPQVQVRGAPFAAQAPRLRMRTRAAAPVMSVSVAGPLFTPTGGAGD